MRQLILIFLLSIPVIRVQAQHSFDFLISSSEDKIIVNGTVDQDGNTILTGMVGPYAGKKDGLVVKIAADGSYIMKRYDKQDTISLFSNIVCLDNGNYLVSGSYGDTIDRRYMDHFWIMTLDQSLEVITEKDFLVNEYYTGFASTMRSVIDHEGNISLVGLAFENQSAPDQYFTDYTMIKLNQEGDTLLTRYYQYPFSQTPYALRQIPQSSDLMLLGGRVSIYGQPTISILNSELEIVSTNSFSISGLAERLSTDTWINDSEFLMAGLNHFNNKRYIDNYIGVYRMNTGAEVFEELVLSIPDTSIYRAWYKSMAYANDTTIYVAGFQAFAGITIPNAVYLFLIDKEMNLLGTQRFFIGDYQYHVGNILATPDNGCLMNIEKIKPDSNNIIARDIYIRKYLRKDFELITRVEDHALVQEAAKVWPNPVTETLHISLESLAYGSRFRLRIYDINGMKYLDKQLTASGNTLQCRVSPLPAGTYVYELEGSPQQLHQGKFIKK